MGYWKAPGMWERGRESTKEERKKVSKCTKHDAEIMNSGYNHGSWMRYRCTKCSGQMVEVYDETPSTLGD